MLRRVRSLLEMVRFSHTLFALPFALTSAALAWRRGRETGAERWETGAERWETSAEHGFSWLQLAGILLCMVFARSAAMAFNRLADRWLDAGNPRTAGRHLPAGLLSPPTVWLFFVLSSAGFIAATLIFVRFNNWWPLWLSVPVLVFICLYSYTKRFTALAHFWLGVSLLLAPLAAWIAVRGLDALLTPLVLGGAVLFWVAGFDILYACQDVDFDRKAGLHSIPVTLGVPLSLRVALVCHLVMLGLLFALYWVAAPELGGIYLTGIVAVGLLLVYEHWLVRPDDLSRVNQAFFQVNAVISLGLFGIVLLQLACGS